MTASPELSALSELKSGTAYNLSGLDFADLTLVPLEDGCPSRGILRGDLSHLNDLKGAVLVHLLGWMDTSIAVRAGIPSFFAVSERPTRADLLLVFSTGTGLDILVLPDCVISQIPDESPSDDSLHTEPSRED